MRCGKWLHAMIAMERDDDAHLDSEDEHICRGGDDQEEVGHVHQPRKGQWHRCTGGLVNLINIYGSPGSMTYRDKGYNSVKNYIKALIAPESKIFFSSTP